MSNELKFLSPRIGLTLYSISVSIAVWLKATGVHKCIPSQTTIIRVFLLSDVMHDNQLFRMPPPRAPEMGGYGGGDDMRGGGGGHMNYEADRGYPPAERYHYHYNTHTHPVIVMHSCLFIPHISFQKLAG